MQARLWIGFTALLVLATGIVGAGEVSTLNPASGSCGLSASAEQTDWGLTIPVILLGSGMFYLFRPVRRVPVDLSIR